MSNKSNKKMPLAKKPVKKPKVLGNYTFEESTYLNRDKMKEVFDAICNNCKAIIKGSVLCTSNFTKHLRIYDKASADVVTNVQPTISFSGPNQIKVAKTSVEL
jgi:hypothetical protein